MEQKEINKCCNTQNRTCNSLEEPPPAPGGG